MIRRVHVALLKIGKELSGVWLILASIIIWISFPTAVLFASVVGGYWLERWLGGGFFVLLLGAAVIGIFLMVYVWHPFIREAADRAGKAMLGER